jgi:2,3,4,5-tetrahydropyridine-2-carboxylate N-succinyltransferase
MSDDLQEEISKLFRSIADVREGVVPDCVSFVIGLLDSGVYRICDYDCDRRVWVVNEWLKQAILLYFRYSGCVRTAAAYDKVPQKFETWEGDDFKLAQIRVANGAIVRYGAFLERGVVLMNCFVNIGAYVGADTMVDSFSTIGSCAQIGARCHVAAGSVIGGVLEPVGAKPVIIEDNCLIGANSAIVEGVVVHSGATIAMGTRIGASTKIIDRKTNEEFFGEIPRGAIVVPATYSSSNGLAISCAAIVGYSERDWVNSNLRNFRENDSTK